MIIGLRDTPKLHLVFCYWAILLPDNDRFLFRALIYNNSAQAPRTHVAFSSETREVSI